MGGYCLHENCLHENRDEDHPKHAQVAAHATLTRQTACIRLIATPTFELSRGASMFASVTSASICSADSRAKHGQALTGNVRG